MAKMTNSYIIVVPSEKSNPTVGNCLNFFSTTLLFAGTLMIFRVDLRCSYRQCAVVDSTNKLNHLCRLGVACPRQVPSEIIRIIFHLSNCLSSLGQLEQMFAVHRDMCVWLFCVCGWEKDENQQTWYYLFSRRCSTRRNHNKCSKHTRIFSFSSRVSWCHLSFVLHKCTMRAFALSPW